MHTDSALIEGYLEHVRVEKRLAARTVELYALDLAKLQKFAAAVASPAGKGVALLDVRNHHIRRWVATMHSGGRSGRGIALILSGWRGFYAWLGRQGLVASNPVQDVRSPKAPKPLPKALGVDDAVQFADFQSDDDPWLEARDCDVAMMAVGVLPSRAERVAFSKPYLASPVYGVTSRDNPRVNRFEDIDQAGITVAVAAGTLMEPLMRQTLRHAELLVVRAPRTREAEVQAGRADVFMSDFPYTRRMLLMHDWARIIEPPARFGETLYAYAVAKGDAAWLSEVNAFVTDAKADGSLARAAARHGLTPILFR